MPVKDESVKLPLGPFHKTAPPLVPAKLLMNLQSAISLLAEPVAQITPPPRFCAVLLLKVELFKVPLAPSHSIPPPLVPAVLTVKLELDKKPLAPTQ